MIRGLEAGTYDVVIAYNPTNTSFVGNSTAFKVTVDPAHTNVTITSNDSVVYNEAVSVDFEIANINGTSVLPEFVVGEVTVSIDGIDDVDYTVSDGNVVIRGLEAGVYEVTIQYTPNNISFTGNETSVKVSVKQVQTKVIVNASDVVYNNDVTVEFKVENINTSADVPSSENVSVIIIGNKYGEVFNDNVSIAAAKQIVSDLNADTYTVSVAYLGDDNFVGSSAEYVFTVSKANSTVSVPDVEYYYLGSDTVSVTTVNATGITANVVDHPEAEVVINGNDITVSGLDAGTYTLSVSTTTDDNHNSATDTADVTVKAIPTSISFNEDLVIIGNNLTFSTVNITDGSTVTLVSNNKKYSGTVKDNVATVVIDDAETGTFDATVSYDGNNNYIKSSADSSIKFIAPDSFTALQMLIDESNGTVVLDKNYTFDPNTDSPEGIVIDKPVSIDANGNTLDANGSSPVFNVTADDVSISNATFTGANGTVIDINSDNVSVADSSFVNNTVSDGQSLIDASGTNGTDLSGNDFTDNVLDNATAIDLSGSSGANVENVSFTGNDVTDSTLIDASESNGSEITGTEISGNNLTGSTGIDVSGSDDPVVEDTVISGNDVEGTVLVDASNTTDAEVSGTEITGNNLTGSTGVDVSGSDNASVANTSVVDNDIDGSVLVDASESTDVEIVNTNVTDNELTNTTVIDLSGSVDPKVQETVIEDNSPISDSTLIDASNTSGAEISGTEISGNELENSTGIDVSGSDDPVVADTVVSGNDVEGTTLIDASESSGAEVTGTEISGNNLTDSTGVDVSGSDDSVVEDTVISGNDVVDSVLVDASDSTGATVNNITFADNNLTDVIGIDTAGAEGIAVSDVDESGNVYDSVVVVSVDDVSVGEDAVVNVAVVSSYIPVSGDSFVVDGNVTVTVDGKDYNVALVDGKASVPVSGLKAGEYDVTATYLGSESSKPAVGNDSFVVSKVADYPMGIENTTVDYGSDLIVDLPEDATGNVSVVIGNKTVTVPVVDGRAVISTEDIVPGEYPVSVVYSGDDKYAAKNITDDVSIVGGIIVDAADIVKYFHGSERFVVNVTTADGKPVEGADIAITINGVTYKRVSNANGTTSLAINLNSGVYNTTVVVDNETSYSTVTVMPTILADDLVKMYRNGTQFVATFLDSEGNYLADGTSVTFDINGVHYVRYVRGSQGQAKLNINLAQGEYYITANNPVTGENRTNKITVIPYIVENNDLIKYYRNASQYVVRVLDETGNFVAGKSVTFNINGVFYTRTTNASGYAKLNINLAPGTYVITAEYNGCRVSNNIEVLPVLSASDLTKKYGSSDQFVATVLDGQGNPYANQTVTFNVHGVLYNRITDSEGHAKLNINLQAGKYIITSSYNGTSISNTIRVTA